MMNEDSLLTFQVLTPEGIIFELANLDSVNVPLADNCPIGIRPGHAPLIAETNAGSVTYRDKTKIEHIDLYPGVLQIRDNIVKILTAGRLGEEKAEPDDSVIREYDRLMQTLIKKLSSEDEPDVE
jgi:F0F1-type ATP synthase epsilon subunit